MPHLVLFVFLGFFFYLLKKDIARREGVSGAIWIPTLWVGIQASRPVSTWIGFGGGSDSLEGSPADRLFYFACILAGMFVLSRRRLNLGQIIAGSWGVFLFYGFLLISVLWADSTVVSFKRWFKDFGNIVIALVILTEKNPIQAFQAVFLRCAYLLIPLSLIFLRYFPHLGRRYNAFSGGMEAVGVTFQKNSLGTMVVVCGLVVIWAWFERSTTGERKPLWERLLPPIILGIGMYLLHVCDSKTSMLCLGIGGCILAANRLPLLRKRIGKLGALGLVSAVLFFVLDNLIGIKEELLLALGRDATLTGRTDVWRELLSLNTDPIIGTGFCSFWSDEFYLSKLPSWVAHSAHNGYLEMYIDGGYLGVFFLILMLFAVALKLNRHLAEGTSFALIRFAVLVATIIGSISESHFGRMTPLWFMFLLSSLDPPNGVPDESEEISSDEHSDDSFAPVYPLSRG